MIVMSSRFSSIRLSRRAPLALALLAVLFLAGCDAPDWWPRGVDFPPPKPENWEGEWPPAKTDERFNDPQFWLDIMRGQNVSAPGQDRGEGRDPANPEQPGFRGHETFSRFPLIGQRGHEDAEIAASDCGVFSLPRSFDKDVPSCDPFPAAAVRPLCADALNADAARQACTDACSSPRPDGKPRQCTEAKFYQPEVYATWYCTHIPAEAGETPETSAPELNKATCTAVYLCECK